MNAVQLKQEDQQSKWIGLSVTVVAHALLLLFLIWSVLHTPDPPLDGGGSELALSLGEPDMGGPSDVPVADPAAVEPVPEQVQDDQQTVTQDVEEVNVVAKPVEVKKPVVSAVTKPVVTPIAKPKEPPVEKPRVADARSLFQKKSTATGDGGHGAGKVPGNEGSPNGVEGGSPDGNGVTGNGSGGTTTGLGPGNGPGSGPGDGLGSLHLTGRTVVRKPVIIDNSRETGKVVVGITVDRTGRVIKVQPGIQGTTNLHPALLEKARQGALDTRISPKPDGPEEQYGTMEFVFTYKQ